MYTFQYNRIVSLYGERAKLQFTDTDSLCYEIQTADVYADMRLNFFEYHTSDYLSDHPLYSKDSAKVIEAYCCLMLKRRRPLRVWRGRSWPRPFAMLTIDVVCLTNKHQQQNSTTHSFTRSHTPKYKKSALLPYVDKRYLLTCSEPYAYGHFCRPR